MWTAVCVASMCIKTYGPLLLAKFKHAIAVYKAEEVVSHVPRKISFLCSRK